MSKAFWCIAIAALVAFVFYGSGTGKAVIGKGELTFEQRWQPAQGLDGCTTDSDCEEKEELRNALLRKWL